MRSPRLISLQPLNKGVLDCFWCVLGFLVGVLLFVCIGGFCGFFLFFCGFVFLGFFGSPLFL